MRPVWWYAEKVAEGDGTVEAFAGFVDVAVYEGGIVCFTGFYVGGEECLGGLLDRGSERHGE